MAAVREMSVSKKLGFYEEGAGYQPVDSAIKNVMRIISD